MSDLALASHEELIVQHSTSVEANTIDMSTFNYTDYSHLSVIQVYKQVRCLGRLGRMMLD